MDRVALDCSGRPVMVLLVYQLTDEDSTYIQKLGFYLLGLTTIENSTAGTLLCTHSSDCGTVQCSTNCFIVSVVVSLSTGLAC